MNDTIELPIPWGRSARFMHDDGWHLVHIVDSDGEVIPAQAVDWPSLRVALDALDDYIAEERAEMLMHIRSGGDWND